MKSGLATSFKGDTRRETADYARCSTDDEGWCVSIIEAHEGWLSWWQDGSRFVTDLIASAWMHRRSQLGDRLIEQTATRITSGFASLPSYDGGGAASIVVVSGERDLDQVLVEWIGGGHAILVRNGAIVERTRPHTLWNELIDQGHAPADESERARAKAAFPHHEIVSRIVRASSSSSISPTGSSSDLTRWNCEVGDLIIVASSELDEGDRALVDLATEPAPIESRSRHIAEHVRSRCKAFDFGTAAAVIEI